MCSVRRRRDLGRIRPRDEADAEEDLDDAAQHDDDARTEGAELEAAAARVAQDSTAFPRGAKVDTVRFHHVGWSDPWDETVPLGRVRVP